MNVERSNGYLCATDGGSDESNRRRTARLAFVMGLSGTSRTAVVVVVAVVAVVARVFGSTTRVAGEVDPSRIWSLAVLLSVLSTNNISG